MKFRLGINYWPVTSAMYWWRCFDAEEVVSDFARIREAEFDSVRIFLLWEDFQPAPDRVADEALTRLTRVADIAAENSLSLLVTLFTGHMSGANWIPQWALETVDEAARFHVISGGRVVRAKLKNWYSNQGVMRAQALLAREVAMALKGHPALWAYDLGNENSNCVLPPSSKQAMVWLEAMTTAIRSIDPSRPITLGLHMEDLEEDRNLGPREAARVCDFLCMHGYPIYAGWARSHTDEMILPFLGLVTRWLGGREVLFEEFGAPTIPRPAGRATRTMEGGSAFLLSEEEAAQYTHRALEVLHRFGLIGAMLWCYGDYVGTLRNRPPLDEAPIEPFFGLWRSDHSLKPAVAEIKTLAGSEGLECPDDFSWIELDPGDFYRDPRANLGRLYQSFCRSHSY